MYKEKSNRELIKLLEVQKSLTFESQLKLKSEFDSRDIVIDTTGLENSIENKISKIKNLDYLKNLGFQFDNQSKVLKIKRTRKAIIIDVFAVVLGLVFCRIGFYGIVGLGGEYYNENELNIMLFIINGIKVVIGFLGVTFLIAGVKRLIDYNSFEFTKNNNIIILKKRFDLKLVEIQKDESLLKLNEKSEIITLEIDNIKILSGNADNIVQQMTIKELLKRFKN